MKLESSAHPPHVDSRVLHRRRPSTDAPARLNRRGAGGCPHRLSPTALAAPWGLLRSWNGTGLDGSGAWAGVKCLAGTLSDRVGQLAALRKLSLFNALGGRVPAAVGLLRDLRGLYLFNNRFADAGARRLRAPADARPQQQRARRPARSSATPAPETPDQARGAAPARLRPARRARAVATDALRELDRGDPLCASRTPAHHGAGASWAGHGAGGVHGAVVIVLLIGVEAGSAELISAPATSSWDEKKRGGGAGSLQRRSTAKLS
ncbi:hypothetical protein QYE76_020837 [Lolium multiflorum]|uniref:Uncharacterized protein n=1 Tax=Lolium multiflorum TaxID=4521 RepID=A0AAD8VSA3_LOLMU|nr:hypothetical protein QYE76_020837 [Lolium multiflorum]